VQAVRSGHEGDRARARSRLADAKRIAEQLGADRNEGDTEFSTSSEDGHRTSLSGWLAVAPVTDGSRPR
jgi:hypothetical protein